MNLQQLTTFCTILSEGSMTAAADKLFLTQPAVSQQIRSLEEELEVPLLVRGVRQVKPTVQGQLLYDYAKRILHLTHQAEVAIQTMSQEISGFLRVGTINSIGMYLVSPIIGLFLKHNTNLNIQLTYGSFDKIKQDVEDDKLDVVILPDVKTEIQKEFTGYNERFLLKDEMWLVGSGRDTSLPTLISAKDFPAKPIIIYSEMYPAFKEQMEQILTNEKVEFMPVFETDNVGTLKRVIESGLGWGFLPSHSIKKQVRTRRLSLIRVEGFDYSVNINMYSRRTDKIRQMSDVFYRALQQQALSN